jgi:FkbM family methyltransferase
MKIKKVFLSLFRIGRVVYKRVAGIEPTIRVTRKTDLKYHGNRGYGGWSIPDGFLRSDSVVVDVGLGEDISFSESLIADYGCHIHGFDPTPRSIAFVESKRLVGLQLNKLGVAGTNRSATFFLPNNPHHVSGSITKSAHVGSQQTHVQLIDMEDVFRLIGKDIIDLLKIDIEGAEYELINSAAFASKAQKISVLCIEFHHRWPEFGPDATISAVSKLKSLGFECIWQARETNEEFTFVNTHVERIIDTK